MKTRRATASCRPGHPRLGGLVALILLLGAAVGCRTTPYGGGPQQRRLSEAREIELGTQAYAEILRGVPIETDTPRAAMVQRVGARLASGVDKDYAWTFRLVRDDRTIDAFCLPGGKLVVYAGILPITQNEDGLAAVLAHGIAHALARHGAQRVSRQGVAESVLAALEVGLDQARPGVRLPALAALGLGTEVGTPLPYSRLHEHEADGLGLRLMVRAGYNPHEAVRVWQRMAQAARKDVPALVSTHPEPRIRAERMARLIPRILSEERRAAPER